MQAMLNPSSTLFTRNLTAKTISAIVQDYLNDHLIEIFILMNVMRAISSSCCIVVIGLVALLMIVEILRHLRKLAQNLPVYIIRRYRE